MSLTDLQSTQKNPDDVVITLALRTPLTKARKGGFKDTELDFIIYALLKETLAKSQIDPALIEDVCLGNVCPSNPLPRLSPISNSKI
jgi:acetyl-CoA acetyltransferase